MINVAFMYSRGDSELVTPIATMTHETCSVSVNHDEEVSHDMAGKEGRRRKKLNVHIKATALN